MSVFLKIYPNSTTSKLINTAYTVDNWNRMQWNIKSSPMMKHASVFEIKYIYWVYNMCVVYLDLLVVSTQHDDVIKWKHFPRYWPFVRGIHRSSLNSPHKGQWRGALMFSLIYTWINGWINNRGAGDLRRNPAHYAVMVMASLGPAGMSM